MTIGHSTHPIAEFIAMLKEHGVERVVDVRTVPKSRHNPQFEREALRKALNNAGLHYTYMGKTLGGFRRPEPDSVNMAWRNTSFRGYADYMQTPEFAEALEELEEVATKERVAIMCAESVPWRCHRSLISDALMVQGWKVFEIVSMAKAKERKFPEWARVEDGRVSYPLSGRLSFDDD